MARKRKWHARAGYQEEQSVFLDQGPQDLPSARGMVRRRRGNVFAPVTTVNVDREVLASLALPCPRSEVGEPQVFNCLSLRGSAMFGADTVEEFLRYVGSVLSPTSPHPGVVAVEPPATVEGGGAGGAPGHELDSSSISSKGSNSCESSNSDVRILQPPVGKGVTAVPSGSAPRSDQHGRAMVGLVGPCKRKRQAPPANHPGRTRPTHS